MIKRCSLSLNHPALALIKCVQSYSNPLAEDAIHTLIDELYRDAMVQAEYLFVNEKGAHELDILFQRYRPTYIEVSQMTRQLSQYRGLHVTVLPTLPEGIFLVGILDIEQRVTPQGTRLASTTRVPMSTNFTLSHHD